MKDKLYELLPDFFQNILISLFNFSAYRKRYGGSYNYYLKLFESNRCLSLVELKKIQEIRFSDFMNEVNHNSSFYKDLFHEFKNIKDISKIGILPIVDKELLRKNIEKVYAIDAPKGIISKTGGTTGKSLTVLFTPKNMQERFAMLDDFRGRYSYKLGKKTAWFSGKKLLSKDDVNKNRFWKTDYLYKVRYYSTFHIKEDYLKFYILNLVEFQPEFIVGFPSSILEIAKYGLQNKIDFPENTIKAIFPTAETITAEMRLVIETFFKTKMYNQYASSEGAPFIFECTKNKLHLELQSGVFEVLDEQNNPSKSGKLVVTSFTTEGTPLIRYDIGDSITLEDEDEKCTCGNNNPLVKEILGRIDDYLYSPEMGKINLGNISNTLKDVEGVVRFQAVQNDLNSIEISVIKDGQLYSTEIEKTFLQNWKDRFGTKMIFKINYVSDIEVEKSGKFRMVKNNIKHLLDV